VHGRTITSQDLTSFNFRRFEIRSRKHPLNVRRKEPVIIGIIRFSREHKGAEGQVLPAFKACIFSGTFAPALRPGRTPAVRTRYGIVGHYPLDTEAYENSCVTWFFLLNKLSLGGNAPPSLRMLRLLDPLVLFFAYRIQNVIAIVCTLA